MDNLQQVVSDNSQYKAIIEKVKESFRSELKVQPKFLAECLQGEILHYFQEGGEELLTLQSVKNILNYYKPLMQHKTYMQQQHWLQQCYKTQSFLPPPQIIQQRKDDLLQVAATSPSSSSTQDNTIRQGTIRYLGKLMWEHLGKIITLGLATQVATGQALAVNTTQRALMLEDDLNSLAELPLFPALNSTNHLFFLNRTGNPLQKTSRAMIGWQPVLEEETNLTKLENITYPVSQTINHSRQKRTVDDPFAPSNQDQIVLQDLIDIAESLRELSKSLSPNTIDSSIPSNTQKIITYIKDHTSFVVRQVNLLKQVALNCMTADGYKATIASLQEEIKNITRYADDLSRNHTQEIGRMKDQLDVELHKVQSRINQLEQDKEKLKQDNERGQANFKRELEEACVSNMHFGRYNTALEKFNQLNDDTKLDDIIRRAYDNNLSNFKHIIEFARTFPDTERRIRIFKEVYEEMKRKGHLNSVELVMLTYQLKEVETHNNQLDNTGIWLKNQLPCNIKQLLWNSWVKIESRKHTNYVLDLDGYGSGEIYGFLDNYGDKQKWIVNVQKQGQYFQFKNLGNGKVLGTLEGTREVENQAKKGLCFSIYACIRKHQEPRSITIDDNGKVRGVDLTDSDLQYWQVSSIDNWKYVYFKNKKTGRILDVNSKSKCRGNVDCAKVYAQEDYGDTPSNYYQHWRINRDGILNLDKEALNDAIRKIESRKHPGYVLDLAGDGDSDIIYGYHNHSGVNQQWQITIHDCTYFQFTNKNNGKVLSAGSDCSNTHQPEFSNDNKVCGVYPTNSSLQYWQMTPVEGGDKQYLYLKNKANGHILDVNSKSKCRGDVDCTKVYAREDRYGDTQSNHYQHWHIPLCNIL